MDEARQVNPTEPGCQCTTAVSKRVFLSLQCQLCCHASSEYSTLSSNCSSSVSTVITLCAVSAERTADLCL